MIPRPTSEWTRDGFMSADAPTAKVIQEQADAGRHARLRGFTFAGPGWYPAHRVLVTEAGEKGGQPTYELRFYATDPRPAFATLAALEDKTSGG